LKITIELIILSNTAVQSSALTRFYDLLAYKPWCGDDKCASLVRPRDSAIKKAYIAPNQPTKINWLVFDLDHENAFIWEDKFLPEPNIIVQNYSNGKCHLYYSISPVCISNNGREHPIRFMKALARGMAAALGADEAYSGRIAKNPLSPVWRTSEIHSHEYSLSELSESFEPISKLFSLYNEGVEDLGRNSNLFNQLRYWAYTRVNHYKQHSGESEWLEATLNHALSISLIETDFNYNEIKNTAKSVAKWVWLHYAGSKKNRGVMQLDKTDLPLKARQRLSARRTHDLRSTATESRIKASVNRLTSNAKLPTKTAVAHDTGLTRQQIARRYSHLFTTENKPTHLPINRAEKKVTNGVHQITALCPYLQILTSASSQLYKITIELKDEGD
jgi:hypothetical protein